MRRYYRGKGKDGIWYDGYYIKMNNDSHYIFSEYNDNKLQEVDKNTITEYTNLYDKNDVEICEGDIVQLKYRKNESASEVGVIKFGEYKFNRYDEFPRYLGYYISVKKLVDVVEVPLDGKFSISLIDVIYNGDVEIIGNIFDNPELLEL